LGERVVNLVAVDLREMIVATSANGSFRYKAPAESGKKDVFSAPGREGREITKQAPSLERAVSAVPAS
jgi:hypothetical protein